jgi:PAS domain S-box-containing protein
MSGHETARAADRAALTGRIPGPGEPFRGLLEAAPDAMVIVDGSGIIQLVNAQTETMFGYRREELLGRGVDILVPGRFRGRHGAYRRGYSAQGQVRPMGAGLDLYGLRRDGREFPVEISLSPLQTTGGLLVSAAVRDVSDRRRAEEELARLYVQQSHVALTLQRALMGQPREIPGMRSASRYFPATGGAGVGGDWFDLIALGGGLIGVLIGDVMGRGLEAATVMGQMRSAANALARTGLPPQQLMSALELFARDIPDQLTTCCYLVINPVAGEVTGCSAGHLPVLLVEPDDAVRQLPVPVSAPLGVGDIPHQQATVPVAPHATLVLYTDGLVETHRCDIDEQITMLADQLHAIFTAGPSLEQAADEILAAMAAPAGEPPDDVTLLLAQIPGPPLASAAITLPAEPRSVTAGRQFTGKTLAEWGHPEHTDTACLLVSEILTNALSHARAPIELRVHRSATEIVTEISDDSPRLPQRRLAGPGDESGRGLMLVEALATQWGTRPGPAGKIFWFTIALNQAPRPQATAP